MFNQTITFYHYVFIFVVIDKWLFSFEYYKKMEIVWRNKHDRILPCLCLDFIWRDSEAVLITTNQIKLAFLEETEKMEILTEQPDQSEEEVASEPVTSWEVIVQSETSPAIIEQQRGSLAEPRRSIRTKDPNRMQQPDFIYY